MPRRSRPSGGTSGSCPARASTSCSGPSRRAMRRAEPSPSRTRSRGPCTRTTTCWARTRFLVVARDPAPPELARKTSLVFTLPNVPGSLHRALGVFAARKLDLTKIESRPLAGRPWEYAFYLDVVGDPRAGVAEALAELQGLARELRILGAYPGSDIPVAKG